MELDADLDEEAMLAPEVFRTVQEALTNVVRTRARRLGPVAITGTAEETLVLVVDDGTTDSPSPQRGYGLVGLAERISLAGGVLETGPGQGGRGFRVAAVLQRDRAGEVTVRVVVVDDNELLRAGLLTVLGSDPEISVVGEARSGPAGVRWRSPGNPTWC